MRTLITALAAIIAPTFAIAGVCGPDRETDIPVMENAKAAFLAAEYRRFVEIAGDYFPDLESNFNNYFGQVQVVFPNGYSKCETILQRREEPGFAQDLVFMFPEGLSAPVTLHLIAGKVDGEYRLIEFTYNTNISDVMDGLK